MIRRVLGEPPMQASTPVVHSLKQPSAIGRPPLETSVRDIIANLQSSANADIAEILARGVNTYYTAIFRLRSEGLFTANDVKQLLMMWQILLDVQKPAPANFAPHGESEPEEHD